MTGKPLRLLSVGKLKVPFWKDAAAHYSQRINRWRRLECVEVRDGDPALPQAQRNELEGRRLLEALGPQDVPLVLDERGITGAQAQDARRRIGDALDVVIHGCQRLLENLYRDDVLDLTTDIDVLEQMLKRDGLTESDLERAAAQAREAARIDAEANRISRERAARGNVSAQGGQASATATRPNDRT